VLSPLSLRPGKIKYFNKVAYIYLDLDEGSDDPKPVSCGNRSMALFSFDFVSFSPGTIISGNKLIVVGFCTVSASSKINKSFHVIFRS
jgi:hypothetical protein